MLHHFGKPQKCGFFRAMARLRNECGISRDDVAEALNHARRGSDRVTDIYIERDFSRVWEANRKVLDLVGKCYFFAHK